MGTNWEWEWVWEWELDWIGNEIGNGLGMDWEWIGNGLGTNWEWDWKGEFENDEHRIRNGRLAICDLASKRQGLIPFRTSPI